MSFKGKVAIVTGAGQGIGFEICRQLTAKGASVLLNDINTELAVNAAAKISSEENGTCLAYGGDASAYDFIQQMVAKAIRDFGKLDIIIANAGITLFGDFLDYPVASFQRVMEVNLQGSFFLAQAGAKQMITQNTGGSILFTSSVTGHQAHKQLSAYGMSKAALEMLAKNLVIELSPYQITVNAIAPGATLTERTLGDAAYAEIWAKLTPMGRAANVSDIADTALFLVSEKARHITGQTIVVDGGWTSVSPEPY